MALEHLNISLLRTTVTSPDDALRSYPADRLARYPVNDLGGSRGLLVVKLPKPTAPDWLGLLSPLIPQSAVPLQTTSLSAVLFLHVRGRIFALAFGYGRTMLDPRKCEPNFGLRVVLNSVDPDRLRSIDAKTLEDNTVYTRRQLSQAASITTFGFDLHRDLVKAVEGDPRDIRFAKRLAGALSLALDADLELDDIPKKCAEALRLFRQQRYKKRFGWIDHLQLVTDSTEADDLDRQLGALLSGGAAAPHLHLAQPEISDPLDFGGFRFSTDPDTDRNDLLWAEYLATKRANVTVRILKRDQVALYSAASGVPVRKWSIYDCLVLEIPSPGGAQPIHVLTGGDWFAVERSYAQAIAKQIKPLMVDPDPDLPAALHQEKEGPYNERAAGVLNPSAACLDRQFASATDSQDNIEFCDLLQVGRLIHVKKRSASSTLSHLFQQGLVSADLLQTDPGFRSRVHAKVAGLQAHHGFVATITDQLATTAVDPTNYEIRYAIIGPKPKAGRSFLPFFSQVTCARAAAELQARGFKVSVTRIDIP